MPTRIGDEFTLPSGRVVRVTCAPELRRPWHAEGCKSGARVCRAHSSPSTPGVEFYSEAGSGGAMTFDECDAKVLAFVLNTVRRFAPRGVAESCEVDVHQPQHEKRVGRSRTTP